MLVKQVSVFVENETGKLAEITRVLAEANIDLKAMCIAESVDFGILRCIVEDPEAAVTLLKSKGYAANVADVIAVELEDRPGGFADVLDVLTKEGVDIGYVYSTIHSKKGSAMIVLKVAEVGKVIDLLAANDIKLYNASDL